MKIVVIVVLVFVISGCATTQFVESIGSTWRTATPENAVLGGYGIRTVTPDGIIFTQNGSISNSKLKIRKSKLRTIKYTSKKEAEAEVSQEDIGTLGMSYDDLVTKGYKIVITRLSNTKEIANQLSREEDGLDIQYLKRPSLRFVTGVAQIYDHKKTDESNFSGTATVDAAKQFDGKIVLKGSSGKEVELNYEDGSVVAYTYARICWNPDGAISYLQEEAPNPWYLFWNNSFDCASGTLEKSPS